MRCLSIFFSTLAPTLFVAGCGAKGTTPNANAPAASSRLLYFGHRAPYPPPHRYNVTAADRARARAGGWTPVREKLQWPTGADAELLMTDGTVMVRDECTRKWYSLAPNQSGSYVDGTWRKAASLPSDYAPEAFASAVLPDGKLIINGGEFNFCNATFTNQGAIYDPVAKKWTSVAPPVGWDHIGDAPSTVLDNGTYMLGSPYNVWGPDNTDQALLDEASMTWTIVGTGKHDSNYEEGWTLLPSGDVLTVDVTTPPHTEVYVPSTRTWRSAGNTPVSLVSLTKECYEEIGPQTLRPDHTVFVAGATGHTAVYNANTGKWTRGPNFPKIDGQQINTCDAPSSLLTDGSVLVAASPNANPPTTFYIFNGRELKRIAGPPDARHANSSYMYLLLLPTGQVMETDDTNNVEIYTGARTIYPGIAPTITSVRTALAAGRTYTIKGRRFNGASQANFYGDDDQQATNYPLVRITNKRTGHVVYARTHGTSFMGVGSDRLVSTMFDVPSRIETGTSSLVVVTNGIPSTPVSVTIR